MASINKVNNIELDSNLLSIADAIRAKDGINESLTFPEDFIYRINNFEKGDWNEDAIVQRTISGVYTNERLTVVGQAAFQRCYDLVEINMPNVTVVKPAAFKRCGAKYINFPKVEGFNTYAGSSYYVSPFQNLTNTQIISLPALKRLPSRTFQMYPSIGSGLVSNSLYKIYAPKVSGIIGDKAFGGCTQLSDLTIDYSKITWIGLNAFQFCSKLTFNNIIFTKCNVIAASAFLSCGITYGNFPALSTIATDAFMYCKSLTSLFLPGSKVVYLYNRSAFIYTPMTNSTYLNPSSYGTIYVPSSLLTSYKNATNWAAFSSRFSAIEDYVPD